MSNFPKKDKKNKRNMGVVKLFPKKQRWEKDRQDIKRLNEEIAKIPERSLVYSSQIKNFFDLPISQKTLIGLKDAGYMQPTEIQRESLGLALRGLDILGAAKTGSGKTLAFVIPILELLYRNEWTHLDRIGALIISPSREVAMQTFNTIKNVGKKHDFSLGLFIGGQGYDFEKHRLRNINIFVGTPGRVLHHMNENQLMDCTNLKILVLDEADQILENSFAKEVDAIIENLPQDRQTLLFSATQTKSVKDLARLSMRDPVYVSVHENSSAKTPDGLTQNYVICELHEKFNFLWSFIKKNLKKKTLVFMTTCKQVKFAYEAICRLRPGVSVLALYGGMHQEKRIDVYNQFCNKYNVVLLATDLASRGLDFPEVNWVVQMDCPDDPTSYIHRVGRTARYEKKGCALLMLLPSEEAMVSNLTAQRIPISRIQVNPKNQLNVQKKLEILLTQFLEFKEKAQRAVVDYVKAYFVKSDKTVFDVTKLNVDAYARSLGLATSPRIRAIEKKLKSQNKSFANRPVSGLSNEKPIESESEDEETNENSLPTKSNLETYNFGYDSDGEEDDQLFTLKRKHIVLEDNDEKEREEEPGSKKKLLEKPKTKAKVAKKILKKNIKASLKIKFDDEGEIIQENPNMRISETATSLALTNEGGIDIENAKLVLREQDKLDKEIYRKRIKAEKLVKKLRKKEKARKLRQQEIEEENEEDENNSPTDDWSSGDESPDLDFLPDPDKVYDNDNKDGEDDSASDDNDDEDSDREIDEQEGSSESENISHNHSEEEESEYGDEDEESEDGDEESENGDEESDDGDEESKDEENELEDKKEESEGVKLTNKSKSLPKQRYLFKNRSLIPQKKSVNYSELSLQDSESLALQLLNN